MIFFGFKVINRPEIMWECRSDGGAWCVGYFEIYAESGEAIGIGAERETGVVAVQDLGSHCQSDSLPFRLCREEGIEKIGGG